VYTNRINCLAFITKRDCGHREAGNEFLCVVCTNLSTGQCTTSSHQRGRPRATTTAVFSVAAY